MHRVYARASLAILNIAHLQKSGSGAREEEGFALNAKINSLTDAKQSP